MEATAGTIAVNTLDDELISDGDCSLREAIEAANTNLAVDGCAAGEAAAVDTITFAVEGTITVSEQLVIAAGGPLVIDGGNEITISGGETTRVISVNAGSTLTLQRLTIADGYTEGENGAGLYDIEADITILECQFLHNRMGESSRGGGIYSQDGILSVVDSLFEWNGSSVSETYCGGGDISGGQAEFIRTTFLHNEGGGYYWIYLGDFDPGGGGLCNDYASVIIRESSFIANTGGEGGGGVLNRGNTTIINSTFSNNIADGGEYSMWVGGGGGGGIRNEGNLTLINSTLSKNESTAGTGGGITGNAYIANSIIADNFPVDCAGSITDEGHNISSDDTCGFDIANSSLPNTDPLLGPLQDNGGPTETYALLDGSPAIDAGSPENCPEIDQRGIPRPVDGDLNGVATCDMGAKEYQPGDTVTTILSDTPDPSAIGYPFTVSFRVTSTLGTPTGEVTVTVNDSPATCSAMLVDGQGSCQLTLDALGVHLLTASYAGAKGFDACSDSEPHSVVPTSITTITSDDPDPSLFVEPFTVAVNVSSPLGIPPGIVTVTVSDSPVTCNITLVDGVGACQLMLDTIGEYLLTATYEGAEIFDPSSDSEPHRVSGYLTKTTITSDEPDPSSNYDSFTVEFTVTSAWGIPTGEVIVTNGTSDSCQATLVNGLGSCSMFIEDIGDHLLTATYTGSQVFDPSSDSEPHSVYRFCDGIYTTITSDEPDPSDPGEPFTVTFKVDTWVGLLSGNVIVTVSDSPITCTSELIDWKGFCVMTIDTEGMYTLTADYEGDTYGAIPCSDSELHYVGEYKVSYLPLAQK